MRTAARLHHLAARTAGSAPAALNHHHPTMPPGFTASIGDLNTFILPEKVSGSVGDQIMAKAMITAWRRDGILQVAMSNAQRLAYDAANASSRAFFRRSPVMKQRLVDSKSYSGYIGSGEEITNGIADYSEIFTVTKDLTISDPRVAADWPCHGPCPWPDRAMKNAMTRYMDDLGRSGETLLQLIEIGLGVPQGSLTKYTRDGWHHMRVLRYVCSASLWKSIIHAEFMARFPQMNNTNGKGKKGRGIGSHTDYGLLVMAAQDHVGGMHDDLLVEMYRTKFALGLFVRPPQTSDTHANWERSAAGHGEEDAGWVYVPPSPGVFTVFPGTYSDGSLIKQIWVLKDSISKSEVLILGF